MTNSDRLFLIGIILFAVQWVRLSNQLLDTFSKKLCPDCDERVSKGANVCKYCSYRFPKFNVAAETKPISLVQGEYSECPSCGRIRRDDLSHCPGCNSPIDPGKRTPGD
jgi:hypothetical protein